MNVAIEVFSGIDEHAGLGMCEVEDQVNAFLSDIAEENILSVTPQVTEVVDGTRFTVTVVYKK